jgi:YD repeat-containing protein
MKKFSARLFYSILISSAISQLHAQTKNTQTLQLPPANIAIDGDIKEWGDSLRYYNAEKMINFSLANTKDTLYMAMRVNDRLEQMRILRAGFTFSIDTKGKKKEAYSLTFPLDLQGGTPLSAIPKEDNGEITQQDRDELIRERLTTLRGIKVFGFKDIEGDMITTSNTYGIQTAINYDDKGYLVCEAAIPLKFFHANDATKNEWAFNFKINGVQRKPQGEGAEQEGPGRVGGGGGSFGGGGGRGGGRGGRSGGGRGGQHNGGGAQGGSSELSKSIDFWEKYYLAK